MQKSKIVMKTITNNLKFPEDIMSGQIWGLSWGGEEEYLVVIKNLRESNFTACPLDISDAYYPSIEWESQTDYKVWPNIDFHFDYSLLRKFYGEFMSPEKFYSLSSAESEASFNLKAEKAGINVCQNYLSDDFSAVKLIITKYTELMKKSSNDISSINRYSFIPNALKIDPNLISESLGFTKSEAVRIGEGNLSFDLNTYQKIEFILEESLSESIREEKSFEELSMPWWKESIIQSMKKLNKNEEEVRSLIIKRACAPSRNKDAEMHKVVGEIIEGLLNLN